MTSTGIIGSGLAVDVNANLLSKVPVAFVCSILSSGRVVETSFCVGVSASLRCAVVGKFTSVFSTSFADFASSVSRLPMEDFYHQTYL